MGYPPNRKRGNKPRHIETEAALQGILGLIAKASALDADSALEIVRVLEKLAHGQRISKNSERTKSLCALF
ncbi:hypothetical protein FACS1894110_04850 [Spirochaetia bacterium]|nr:hypothetical protein FACS1894110_04850 [Spirochaetia bacterium]